MCDSKAKGRAAADDLVYDAASLCVYFVELFVYILCHFCPSCLSAEPKLSSFFHFPYEALVDQVMLLMTVNPNVYAPRRTGDDININTGNQQKFSCQSATSPQNTKLIRYKSIAKRGAMQDKASFSCLILAMEPTRHARS